MRLTVVNQHTFSFRLMATTILAVMFFVGPGMWGCTPASDDVDVEVSEDAAMAGFWSSLRDFDSDTAKQNIILQMVGNGFPLRDPNNNSAHALVPLASNRILRTEHFSNEKPLLSLATDFALSFETPWDDVNDCLDNFLTNPAFDTALTVCGDTVEKQIIAALFANKGEAIEIAIQVISNSIATGFAKPGAAIYIETFLRAKFYEHFQSAENAQAFEGMQNEESAFAFLDKVLSEILLPGKAHAQALGGLEYVLGAVLLVVAAAAIIYTIVNIWNQGGFQVSGSISIPRAVEASQANNEALMTLHDVVEVQKQISRYPQNPPDPQHIAEALLAIQSQLESYASNAWIVASQSSGDDAFEDNVFEKLIEAQEQMVECLEGDQDACALALDLFRELVLALYALVRAILLGRQIDPELMRQLLSVLTEVLVLLDDYGRALGPDAFDVFADLRVAICMVTEATERGAVEDEVLVEDSFTSILMTCFKENLPKP